MAHNPIRRLRQCRDDRIDDICDAIDQVSIPEYTRITGTKQEVEQRKRFFPTKSLREILNLEVVKSTLAHECDNCKNHLEGARAAQPSQYSPERILNTDAAVNLFALLILLKYPLLIGCFLSFYSDEALPEPRYFSQFDLRDRQFRHLQNDRSKHQLLTEFQEKKWRFSVPSLTDGSFQIYEEGTLLPYLEEEPIEKGGFGKVFKVSVHSSYCTLGQSLNTSSAIRSSEPIIFARKEIIDPDAIEFVNERTNLEHIATLQHPNLVSIQKTYQLGEKFNILFPFAKTNLHHYLRDKRWRAPQHVILFKSRLWDQVLGITEALSKIITFTDPSEPDNPLIFGYHLDLKPSNILIDGETTASKDLFKITDFGQTKFIEAAFAGTTRIVGGGGTDAYAPPEFLGPEQDRVYDVWSLGIIVLEVLAFAVRGTDGLVDGNHGLDSIRFTTEGEGKNARFYTKDELSGKWVVKKPILDWMELLVADAIVKFSQSQDFVFKLRDLIVEMLEPDMKARITIDKVLLRMQDIFEVSATKLARDQADLLREPDEKILVDERQVDFYPRGVWERQSFPSSLIILENGRQRLRTFVGSHLRDTSDQRQSMELVAAYQHTADVDNHRFEIRFASGMDDDAVSLQGSSFIVYNSNLARRLQMALTNHILSPYRYRLLDMNLNRYIPFLKRVTVVMTAPMRHFSRLPPDTKPSPTTADPKATIPLWIELWLEHESPKQTPPKPKGLANNGSTGRRLNRQSNPIKEVPLGRVIIYCKKKIFIIPFAKESQLRKSPQRDLTRDQCLTFECMDKRQRDSFRMYCIEPSGRDVLPSIPMHHAALYNVEKESEFECDTLQVRFDRWEEAASFDKLYRNEKARWLHQIKDEHPPYPTMMLGI